MSKRFESAFALPSILIASIVMLIVLSFTLSSVATTRTALDQQYYESLAEDAAQSGLTVAMACLSSGDFIASWSNSSPLRPNSDCDGQSGSCTAADCYVINEDNVRSTFSVGLPASASGSQVIEATGTVEVTRKNDGSIWQTYQRKVSYRIQANLTFNNVTFGYTVASSAFYLVIGTDGKLHVAGGNNDGQLGTGNTASSPQPRTVSLPSGKTPKAVFSNFLSAGFSTFVVADDGTLYATGRNNYGQLGIGTTATPRTTLAKVTLPGGRSAKSAAVNSYGSYIITTDNYVYSMGSCASGVSGTGCSSGNRTSPTRVNLPTPSSNPNTIPAQIVTDARTVFVRMEGGAVYGWGMNSYGQLARGNFTNATNPVRIGNYGKSGHPKAIDIAFDGGTIYIVDDDGDLSAAGRNRFGQLGRPDSSLEVGRHPGECLKMRSGDNTRIDFIDCDDNRATDWDIRSNGQIRSVTAGRCMTSRGNQAYPKLDPCDTSDPNQRWDILYGESDGGSKELIKVRGKNLCLYTTSNTADYRGLMTWTCNDTVSRGWTLNHIPTLAKVDIPATAGNVIKVTTDQWFTSALTDKGQVWGFGLNESGALGNGQIQDVQAEPTRFILPSGAKAVDVTTGALSYGAERSNTFVVLDDGSVYGAGNNTFGQLGVGNTTTRVPTPVRMQSIGSANRKAHLVMYGNGSAIILTQGGLIYGVGNNDRGQLGDGTTINRRVPVLADYLNDTPVVVF